MIRKIPWRFALALVDVAIVVALAGCARSPSLPSDWGMPARDVDGELLSQPIVLLADNQLHHLYGEPVWIRSGLTNRVVSVAIRPVQLDVWGPDLLSWLLDRYAKKRPAVHLGDALDVSCTVEWVQFVELMSHARKGWVMAPGNHDFNYVGNGHFWMSEWARACATADGSGRPMTKDLFVSSYLKALAAQDQLAFPAPADSAGEDGVHEWEVAEGSNFLEAVAWRIDGKRPWRSYVVQRLNVGLASGPPVIVMLLDTNQYLFRPRLVPFPGLFRNAGISGELRGDQVAVVDRWLSERKSEQVTILMGHHPYKALTRGSRAALDRWRQRGVSLYVSAHTHTAQYVVHEATESNWLELSLGSTTDWPPEVRTFSASTAPAYESNSFRMRRYLVSDTFDDLSECEPEWELPPESKAFYISYGELTTPNPTKTKTDLMNTLLSTYDWLLRFVKSASANREWPDDASSDGEVREGIAASLADGVSLGEKLDLLRQLDRFERNRTVADGDLRKTFRMCQALWASKYDLSGARAPNADDSFVLVPKE